MSLVSSGKYGVQDSVPYPRLAERGGEKIPFWEFFRYGALVTLGSTTVAMGYLWLRYLV